MMEDKKRRMDVDGKMVEDEWCDFVEQARAMGLGPLPTRDPDDHSGGTNISGKMWMLMSLSPQLRGNVLYFTPVYSREVPLDLMNMEKTIDAHLTLVKDDDIPPRPKPDPDPGAGLAHACMSVLSLWWILRMSHLSMWLKGGDSRKISLVISMDIRHDCGTVMMDQRYQRDIELSMYQFRREVLEHTKKSIAIQVRMMADELVDITMRNNGKILAI